MNSVNALYSGKNLHLWKVLCQSDITAGGWKLLLVALPLIISHFQWWSIDSYYILRAITYVTLLIVMKEYLDQMLIYSTFYHN